MADTLTREQKIAALQQWGIRPPSTDIKPASGADVELTRDQKIQALVKAGVKVPPSAPPAAAAEPGIMDRNINPLSGTPLIGGEDVSPNGMVQGAISDLPAAGGIVGGVLGGGVGTGLLGPGGGTAIGAGLGAGWGAEAGSYAKDALNNLIYGKQTSLVEAHKNAIGAQEESANAAFLGEGALKIAGEAGKALAQTKVGSAVGELVSGVSAPLIKAYADGAQRIRAAFASADESTFRMAEPARQQYVQDIIQARKTLNDVISEGIKDSKATISVEPIIKNLEESLAKLNPKFDGPQIAEVNALITKAKAAANMPIKPAELTGKADLADFIMRMKAGGVDTAKGEAGKISIQEAQQLKVHMQGIADGAYQEAGASNAATPAQNAAKGAAATVRQQMESVIPKSVAEANAKLSTLHKIEDHMNTSILDSRESAQSMLSAGKNETPAGEKHLADLQDMQKITGTNMVQPAQDLAAAQALGKYKFSPSLRGLGQPAVKAAIDATLGAARGGSTVGSTLGQSVMHGAGAMDSLKQIGD